MNQDWDLLVETQAALRDAWAEIRALQAPRWELSVPELQQALLDVGLIYPDAIDNPEGYDGGDTLERIEMLHAKLRGKA